VQSFYFIIIWGFQKNGIWSLEQLNLVDISTVSERGHFGLSFHLIFQKPENKGF
jgi:hypothetical protein